jgi:VIT1/CCC1 family predicted Fe2+/Mn2+ transporter
MFRLRHLSFGGPAAIVTSMALIVGLNAATVGKAALVGSLLILALADNLTDSLSIHIYQESEKLSEREALWTTGANFMVRLIVALTFIALVLYCESRTAIFVSIVWGFGLLSGLTYLLARERNIAPVPEICKHCGIAGIVIAVSRAVGAWIPALIGSPG